MTRQGDEQGQRYFTYDVTGKTTGVYLDAAHSQPVVTFAYDDRGFRVSKKAYGAEVATSTYYVRDVAGNVLAVYDKPAATGVLQRTEVPLYGASRLGTLTHLPDNSAGGTDDYRYELSDHLGDARVVFHRPTTTIDVETMELGGVPSRAAFLNDDRYRVAADNAPSGQYVARLTDTQVPGQELKRVLAVTRGDTITFSALAQWKQNAASGSGATPYVLVGAAAGVNALSQRGPEGQTVYGTNNANWLSLLAAGLGFTLGQRAPARLGSTALEGWLKYRVLDAQGNPMRDAQGQELKGVDYLLGTGKWEYLQTGVRVPQDGTLEVMAGTSGTGEAVYFDNLRVEQTGGLIVQEQHQYAYGSPLPGLSYSVGNRRYRHGYQGQYAEHDSLTGFDSFELRLYNSRIGRWMSYDPEGQYSSPYVGMGNNPVSRIDPDGGLDFAGFLAKIKAGFNAGKPIALEGFTVVGERASQMAATGSKHSLIGIFSRFLSAGADAMAAPKLAYQRKEFFEANIKSTRYAEAHGISDAALQSTYQFNRKVAFPTYITGTIPGIEYMSPLGAEMGAAKLLDSGIEVEKFIAAGEEIVQADGLTAAGHALTKHGAGARGASTFPAATGNIASKNAQGQAVLQSVLKDPTLVLEKVHYNGNAGYIMDFRINSGYGIRYSPTSHTLVGLLHPSL